MNGTRNILILLAAGLLFAEDMVLTGTVVDYPSGKPVVDALVYVANRSDIEAATTDENGAYRIPPLPTSVVVTPPGAQRRLTHVQGSKTYMVDIRGRRVALLRGNSNSALSSRGARGMANGCYITVHIFNGVLSASKAVVAGGRVVSPVAKNRSAMLRAGPLARRADLPFNGGEVRVYKQGYFSAAVLYTQSVEELPAVYLFKRDQVLGSCGKITARSGSYSTAKPDTLTVSFTEKTEAVTFCGMDDNLLTETVVTPAAIERRWYGLESTKALEIDDDMSQAVPVDEDGDGNAEATILVRSRWLRSGSGTGVQGTWQFAGYSFRVLSGALSDSARASLESEYDNRSAMDILRQTCMTVWGGLYVRANSAQGAQLATTVKEYGKWNFYMRWLEAGSATNANDSSVVLAGTTSGDTIIIHVHLSGDISYTCTTGNPAYPEYTYRVTPDSCPNPRSPEWLSDFLLDNAESGLLKRALGRTNGQ